MIRYSFTTAASFVLALAGLTVFAGAAHADTTLTYRGASGEFKVAVRPGDVRIEDAGPRWQLYDEDAAAVFAINPPDQSYTRLDRDTAGEIRERVEALRERIEARVRQMPENQRRTARAAMLSSMPGLDTREQQTGIERTGRTATVAGIDCDVIQIVRNGQPAESFCVATPAALGMTDASFETLRSMFSLMQTLLAGTGFENAGLPYLSLSGVPIRFTDADTGEQRELADIHHGTLADERFSIPERYVRARIDAAGN